jgi:hypothetical protein
MSYVSKNYDKNSIAKMGGWVGIDSKGVAYWGPTTTDPKADEEKEENARLLEIATKTHKRFYPVDYEYGQCVSYVKAVTPGLPKTSEWKQGAKVSPGYHQKPEHPVDKQHSQRERAAPIHHGAAHPDAAKHGTVVHAAPPVLHLAPEPSMFQQIENALDLHLNLKHYEDEALKGYEFLCTYVQDEYHSFHKPATAAAPGTSTFSAPKIPAGTVIATFTKPDKNGKCHYQGHAAIYEKHDDTGIYVVNQWIYGKPLAISRYKFTYKYGMGLNPTNVNDGDNYYVVE